MAAIRIPVTILAIAVYVAYLEYFVDFLLCSKLSSAMDKLFSASSSMYCSFFSRYSVFSPATERAKATKVVLDGSDTELVLRIIKNTKESYHSVTLD
uniref:hypothetical protein n=1 Tax=Veillonella magna TaxID=464322 RepID=UPI00402ACDB6